MGMTDKVWALRVFKFLGMTYVTGVVQPSFPKDRDIPNWFYSVPHWSGGQSFPLGSHRICKLPTSSPTHLKSVQVV